MFSPISGSRAPNGDTSGSGVRASVQRVVHRRENLIDGDVAIVIRIAGLAAPPLALFRCLAGFPPLSHVHGDRLERLGVHRVILAK